MKQLHIIILLFIFTLCQLQAQNVNDAEIPTPRCRASVIVSSGFS